MGVRESLGRSECVITIKTSDTEYIEQLEALSSYAVVPYTMLDTDCFASMGSDVTSEAQRVPLAQELLRVLASMEVRTVTQRKRWFLQELRNAREIKDRKRCTTELKKLESTLSQVLP